MSDPITLTWIDDRPYRIIEQTPVSRSIDIEGGKTAKVEYTACLARPANESELREWWGQ